MHRIFGFGSLARAALAAMAIDDTPDFITDPNPPKGKGKVMYLLDDKRSKPPVKTKSLKRLLKQKGRK